MKSVAIFNSVGGVGRTTCAVHLALRAEAQGVHTYAVSLDRQGDLLYWLSRGRRPTGAVDTFEHSERLTVTHSPGKVPELPDASFVVYDCPPTVEIVASIKPDLWLVPTPGGRRGLEALGVVLHELGTAGVPIWPIAWAGLNSEAFVPVLRDKVGHSPNVQVWDHAIPESDTIARAENDLSSVWETPYQGKGAQELARLCDGVLAQLGVRPLA